MKSLSESLKKSSIKFKIEKFPLKSLKKSTTKNKIEKVL